MVKRPGKTVKGPAEGVERSVETVTDTVAAGMVMVRGEIIEPTGWLPCPGEDGTGIVTGMTETVARAVEIV